MRLNIFKEIEFIIKLFFIFISEFLFYCFFCDYLSFIDRITRRLAVINILYVKIFQAIALNNNVIDNKINNKLLEFTDNAPWNDSDINFKNLIEVTRDYNLSLKDGYKNPINSGMISLVYKALNKNTGKNVIIKVKRNNIDKKLNDAINNLQTILYILSFIPLINKYQFAEVINKNIDIIKHQTNFQEEINNMNKMRENCKDLKYIKIPKADIEVTKKYPNIILMSFIDGNKINQILEKDYEPFANLIVKFGFLTSIVHGYSHGDLHAGNVLFIKDNEDKNYPHKLGIIDFGIVYKLDFEFKDIIFKIITEIFTEDIFITSKKILNCGIFEPTNLENFLPTKHYNNILNFTAEIINESINNSKFANQFQIYKFLFKFKEYISNPEIMNLGYV